MDAGLVKVGNGGGALKEMVEVKVQYVANKNVLLKVNLVPRRGMSHKGLKEKATGGRRKAFEAGGKRKLKLRCGSVLNPLSGVRVVC
ncbi:hypothetical protein VNO78_23897 [Psophocarpus tetragonolobus]|uniref:Uncharacterized protein n=1 Tax=Psophocarpus tetragonolobus TaxID=3891 RepID=A0AAN9S414_PSOTE